MLQRRLRIGYTRAARLVDTMQERGIVGAPAPGTGVREILDYGPAAPPEEV
jgi:S-DNA-T family DNA segregation ATPase FtsK/SpoIIIE